MAAVALWARIADYLKTALLADMGVGSAYTTLLLTTGTIKVGSFYDPDHEAFPFALVTPLPLDTEGMGPHVAESPLVYDVTYPYEIAFATVQDNSEQCTYDLMELVTRGIEMIATRPALGGLQAADGAVVVRVDPQTMPFFWVGGVGGVNQGKYLGEAALRFDVVCQTRGPN